MPMQDTLFDELDENDALGDVRALIPDTEQLPEPSNAEAEPSYLFSDGVLGRYLRMHGATREAETYSASLAQIKRATADACDALGRSEMLILKKITSQDRSTDGSVLANQYRQMAAALRAEADELDAADEPEVGVISTPYRKRPAAFDGEYAARGMGSRWY